MNKPQEIVIRVVIENHSSSGRDVVGRDVKHVEKPKKENNNLPGTFYKELRELPINGFKEVTEQLKHSKSPLTKFKNRIYSYNWTLNKAEGTNHKYMISRGPEGRIYATRLS